MMPLRPELPPGLGLSRRSETLVRMPRLNFPMIGGAPEVISAPGQTGTQVPVQPPSQQDGEASTEKLEEGSVVEPMRPTQNPTAPANPAASRECSRVIVYGKAGHPECMEAIQDLIDRQVCFTYHDINRDEKAAQQVQAIVGDLTALPVIVQIGARGG